MASRDFLFTLFSANDLPDVRTFGRMKVYAEVSLRNSNKKWQTSVDEVNGTNPNFNTVFKFTLLQSHIEKDPSLILDVQLYCQRTLGDDKHVGQANINLKWLFENPSSEPDSVPVKVGDFTSTQGNIVFSYEFGDLVSPNVVEKVDEKSEKHETTYLEDIAERTMMELVVQGMTELVVEGAKSAVMAALGVN